MLQPFFLLSLTAFISASDIFRQFDPVVFKGETLWELIGTDPKAIVGFKYSNENWVQIPIQIDEMHLQFWDVIKPGDCR